MLATLGGNESPSAKDVKAILSSVGIEAEEASLKSLITALEGKNVEELIAEGSSKLASMPAAGAAAPAAAAGGAAPAAAAGGKAEKKKEEKKEESEGDDDMGFGLFD